MNNTSYREEKLKNFSAAVNSQVDSEIAAILDEAEKEKNIILNSAEAEAMFASEKHFSTGTKKNDYNYIRDLSVAELEMKKAVLNHRQKLASHVFSAVEEKISEYRKTPEYLESLIKTLLIINISGDTEIFLSNDDIKYAGTLKKAVQSGNVTFKADEKIQIGGLSVYNVSKGIINDKTFDSALEEQKKLFAMRNIKAYEEGKA